MAPLYQDEQVNEGKILTVQSRGFDHTTSLSQSQIFDVLGSQICTVVNQPIDILLAGIENFDKSAELLDIVVAGKLPALPMPGATEIHSPLPSPSPTSRREGIQSWVCLPQGIYRFSS